MYTTIFSDGSKLRLEPDDVTENGMLDQLPKQYRDEFVNNKRHVA